MKKIAKSNKGQSLLEYIILTSLIGIFCLATVQGFGDRLKKKMKDMNKKITRDIKIP